MVFEQFFKEYVNRHPEKEKAWYSGVQLYMRGLLDLSDAIKEISYEGQVAEFIRKWADRDHPELGEVLEELLEEGRIGYGDADLKMQLDQLVDSLHFVSGNEAADAELIPLFLKYDTVYGGKKHYIEIMNLLEKVWSVVVSEHNNPEKYQMEKYLMIFTDCAGVMPEESYDYHRRIRSMYKEQLLWMMDREEYKDSIAVAYALFAGCRREFLLSEKYLPTAKRIWESIDTESIRDDDYKISMMMITYKEWKNAI